MSERNAFPRSVAEGFALAAIVHDDPGAELATPGLAQSVRPSATAAAQQLATQPTAQRRAFLRTRIARAQLDVQLLEAAPKRARALLAADVDKQTGRAWLAAALPRAGFSAEPDLKRLLHVLASRKQP